MEDCDLDMLSPESSSQGPPSVQGMPSSDEDMALTDVGTASLAEDTVSDAVLDDLCCHVAFGVGACPDAALDELCSVSGDEAAGFASEVPLAPSDPMLSIVSRWRGLFPLSCGLEMGDCFIAVPRAPTCAKSPAAFAAATKCCARKAYQPPIGASGGVFNANGSQVWDSAPFLRHGHTMPLAD